MKPWWWIGGLSAIALSILGVVSLIHHDDLASLKPFTYDEHKEYADASWILNTFPSVSPADAKTTEIRTIDVHNISVEQLFECLNRVASEKENWTPLSTTHGPVLFHSQGPVSLSMVVDLGPQIVAYPSSLASYQKDRVLGGYEIVEVRQLPAWEAWLQRILHGGHFQDPSLFR